MGKVLPFGHQARLVNPDDTDDFPCTVMLDDGRRAFRFRMLVEDPLHAMENGIKQTARFADAEPCEVRVRVFNDEDNSLWMETSVSVPAREPNA